MKVLISKSFTFDAAHQLPMMPDGHKCRGMHGHTYRVELQYAGDINPVTGIVVDYALLETVWMQIHELIDHKVLNEVRGLHNPTTENLVRWIWEKLVYFSSDHLGGSDGNGALERIRVYESSTAWCELNSIHFSRGSV